MNRREYDRRYLEAHREAINEAKRARYREDKEAILARKRRYYHENRDRILQNCKEDVRRCSICNISYRRQYLSKHVALRHATSDCHPMMTPMPKSSGSICGVAIENPHQ